MTVRDLVTLAGVRLGASFLDPLPSCRHLYNGEGGDAVLCLRHVDEGLRCQPCALDHLAEHDLSHCDVCGRRGLRTEPRAEAVRVGKVTISNVHASGLALYSGPLLLVGIGVCGECLTLPAG